METTIKNSVMASDNNINVANVQVRTANPVAWAQFGHDFTGTGISVEDALKEAGADFSVEKQPLIRVPQSVVEAIRNGYGLTDLTLSTDNIVTSHMATIRTDSDTTLGIVGKEYGVVQNQKAFEFINMLSEVSGHNVDIINVGSLGIGERMFVTAQLGEDMFLSKDDAIKNYVVFTNSHDGSGAVMAFFTPTRVVCQNTLNYAIRHCPNKVVFKHTKYVEHRIDWEKQENRRKALEVFSKGVNFSEKFIANMTALKEEMIDNNFRKDFAARLYLDDAKFKLYMQAERNLDAVDEISTRAKNVIGALNDAIESGVGQEQYRGSKLWLLNGVTTFLHNNRTYKSAEDEFKSLMEGDGAKKVQKAYDFLIA